MSEGITTVAIIVAGGTGERFGLPGGKQLALLAGRPVLTYTLTVFDQAPSIDMMVVVCHPDRVLEYERVAVEPLGLRTPTIVVAGGDARQDSVQAGLAAIPTSCQVVAVHDGARPLVTSRIIESALAELSASSDLAGVVVGHPSYDTLKEVESGRIVSTLDRARIWVAQTPQVFRVSQLLAAYEHARQTGASGTDDASFVEDAGGLLGMCEGSRDNMKITVPEDLDIAAAILAARAEVSDE